MIDSFLSHGARFVRLLTRFYDSAFLSWSGVCIGRFDSIRCLAMSTIQVMQKCPPLCQTFLGSKIAIAILQIQTYLTLCNPHPITTRAAHIIYIVIVTPHLTSPPFP